MSITGIRAARAYVELVMNDNKFTRGLALAEAEMRAFANKCTAIGSQMFGMGAAMLTPIAYSVQQFKEFDDTMRLVRAVTRATMNDFQKLSDKARLLGKTTSFTSQQVADAMANLGRAGFDTKQIDGMIKHVMNLARATQTGIANSAEIVGNAMRQFGLQTKDTEKVVDVLTTTANNSSQTLDDIAQAMKYAAPIAKEFGLTIQDTAYYIGILANQGLKGEMAGTSLRNMLIRLSGADTQAKFTADLQVKIRDAEGRVKNIKQLLDEAGAAMNERGWDQLQRSKWLRDVFGLRAIAGGSKFVSIGDDFKYIMDAIADSEGAAERTAKQMDEGIGGAIRITISAFQELANVIGEAISPELIQFGKYLQGLANEWITFLKYHREAVVSWAKWGSLLSAGGAALFAVGGIVRTIGTTFGGLVSGIKNAIVYFKAFSKASGEVDVEMSAAGSTTRKAGYDFSNSAKEFMSAAKGMLDGANLAVNASVKFREANLNLVVATNSALRAGGRARNAASLLRSAATQASNTGASFSKLGKTLNPMNTNLASSIVRLRRISRSLDMAKTSADKFQASLDKVAASSKKVISVYSNITKGINKLGLKFTEVGKKCSAFNTRIKSIQTSAKSASGAIQTLTVKVSGLGTAWKKANVSVKAGYSAIDKITTRAEKASVKFKTATDTMVSATNTLSKFATKNGVVAKAFDTVSAKAEKAATSASKAEKALGSAGSKATTLGSKLERAGIAMADAGATMQGAGVQAREGASAIESTGITLDNATKIFERVSNEVTSIGISVGMAGTSFKSALTAIRGLTSFFTKSSKAMDVTIKSIQRLARAMSSLATASHNAGEAIGVAAPAVTQAASELGKMAKEANAASVSMSEVDAAAVKAGASISAVGSQAEKTSADIGKTSSGVTQLMFDFEALDAAAKKTGTSLVVVHRALMSTASTMKTLTTHSFSCAASVDRISASLNRLGIGFANANAKLLTFDEGIIDVEWTTRAATEQLLIAGATVEQTGNKFALAGTKIAGAGKALSGLAAVGRAAGSFLGTIGGFVAFTVALNYLFKAFDWYKNLSVVHTEDQEALDGIIRGLKEEEQQLRRLATINDSHQKTNEMLDEAADIIGELQAKYGDLGLSVDRTTQKIEGLIDATKRLAEAQNEKVELSTLDTINELQHNQSALKRQDRWFGYEFVDRDFSNASGRVNLVTDLINKISGKPITVDVTEAIEKYGGKGSLFKNPDWRKLIEPYLYRTGMSQDDMESFFALNNPVSFLDENGRTILVNEELTEENRHSVLEHNERMRQLLASKQKEVDAYGSLAVKDWGLEDVEESTVSSLSMDYPIAPGLDKSTLLTTDALITALQNSDYATLNKLSPDALRYNISNTIGSLEENLKSAEEISKRLAAKTNSGALAESLLAPDSKFGDLGLFARLGRFGGVNAGRDMIGGNLDMFNEQADAIQALLAQKSLSGSEEDQAMNLANQIAFEEFRKAYTEAANAGTLEAFNWEQFEDVASYISNIVLRDILDNLRKQQRNIKEQIFNNAEPVKQPNGTTLYRIVDQRDENGKPIEYRNQGELYSKPVVKKLLTQQYNETTKDIVDAGQFFADVGNLGANNATIKMLVKHIELLKNSLNDLPNIIQNGDSASFLDKRDAFYNSAGLGDALKTKYKEIDRTAEELRKAAEVFAEDLRKAGEKEYEGLPLDKWLTAQYDGINRTTDELRKQASIELAGDNTARRGVEKTHEYLIDILRKMDRDYILQKGRIYGQYGYQNPIEQRKVQIEDQFNELEKQMSEQVQEAKEKGADLYGMNPDEWFKQFKSLNDLVKQAAYRQMYAYYGVLDPGTSVGPFTPSASVRPFKADAVASPKTPGKNKENERTFRMEGDEPIGDWVQNDNMVAWADPNNQEQQRFQDATNDFKKVAAGGIGIGTLAGGAVTGAGMAAEAMVMYEAFRPRRYPVLDMDAHSGKHNNSYRLTSDSKTVYGSEPDRNDLPSQSQMSEWEKGRAERKRTDPTLFYRETIKRHDGELPSERPKPEYTDEQKRAAEQAVDRMLDERTQVFDNIRAEGEKKKQENREALEFQKELWETQRAEHKRQEAQKKADNAKYWQESQERADSVQLHPYSEQDELYRRRVESLAKTREMHGDKEAQERRKWLVKDDPEFGKWLKQRQKSLDDTGASFGYGLVKDEPFFKELKTINDEMDAVDWDFPDDYKRLKKKRKFRFEEEPSIGDFAIDKENLYRSRVEDMAQIREQKGDAEAQAHRKWFVQNDPEFGEWLKNRQTSLNQYGSLVGYNEVKDEPFFKELKTINDEMDAVDWDFPNDYKRLKKKQKRQVTTPSEQIDSPESEHNSSELAGPEPMPSDYDAAQARMDEFRIPEGLPEGLSVPAQEDTADKFFNGLRDSASPDDEKTLNEIGNLEKQYKEFQKEYSQEVADEYLSYLQTQTDSNLPEGQRIGTKSGQNRRIWAKNAEKKASEIKRQQEEAGEAFAYDYNKTMYDLMNQSIDHDIDAARTRQGIAQQIGNEQGAAEEEAYIKQLEQQKAANKYYKELDNIERLEKNRNNDLEQYQKDQKEVDKQEKKINKMKKKNQKTTEEEAKLEEMIRKRDASRDKYLASNEQFGNSANYIAAMNAYGNVQAQQQLWDINRSFSSKGTFDAYETGGQDVATWTAEFKEQTTILGNIEDYLATMASGEYL